MSIYKKPYSFIRYDVLNSECIKTSTQYNTILNHFSFQQTLEIGFSIESVKKTLEIRITKFGTPYPDSKELIEDVLSMEDDNTRFINNIY